MISRYNCEIDVSFSIQKNLQVDIKPQPNPAQFKSHGPNIDYGMLMINRNIKTDVSQVIQLESILTFNQTISLFSTDRQAKGKSRSNIEILWNKGGVGREEGKMIDGHWKSA